MAKEKLLSDRQQAFVAHYLVSRNASDAYRKAGYAAKDANVCGPRLLANVRIAAAVAEGQGKLLEKLSLTADDPCALMTTGKSDRQPTRRKSGRPRHERRKD